MPENEEKELKKFAALARKMNSNDPYVTSVIFATDLKSAIEWFGKNNYQVTGSVYARGK